MYSPERAHSYHDSESGRLPSQVSNGKRKPRTLVLCFDGTSESFDATSTNIIRLFAALEKGRPSEQLVYYQPGIGTYVRPEAPWEPHVRQVAKAIDKGLAWYIGTHINGGYKFLMQHYKEGDRICLFGFSRGAYTARCLAGMLHKVGLLPRSNMEYVDFAYKLYESKKDEDVKRAREFKRTFSVHVEVEFVGVWDTVASVGLGVRNLPFNASETFIRTFRHALAIDERRAKFQPNPWKDRKRCKCGPKDQTPDDGVFHALKEATDSTRAGCGTKKNPSCWCNDDKLYHGGQKTDVLEVWFPGFHSDVGGGNELNEVAVTLANPPLRWMVTEILKANAGVIFSEDAFQDRLPSLAAKVKAFQNAHAPTSYLDVKSHHHDHSSEATVGKGSIMTPPLTPVSACFEKSHEGKPETHHNEVVEPTEEQEANGKQHDMLLENPLWYILEIIPLKQRWMTKKGKQVKRPRFNLGRDRSIDHATPHFHQSVKHRMKKQPNYDPSKQCRHPDRVKWTHEDEGLPQHVKDYLAGRPHC